MAQWRALLKLEAEQRSRVRRLYRDRKVSIDLRRCFSDWIEGQDWDLAAEDEATARTYFQTLLLELDERIKESLFINHNLEEVDFSLLKDHLMMSCPVQMATGLSECLKEEKVLLDSRVVDQRGDIITTERTQTDLENQVKELKDLTTIIEEGFKVLEAQEAIFKEWESKIKQLNGFADPQMRQLCHNQGNFIGAKKQELLDQVKRSVSLAAQIVQALVSVELPDWKRKQQMSCIGNPVRTGLEQLEERFTSVGETLLWIVRQLNKLQTSDVQPVYKCASELLFRLLSHALVVEEQPSGWSQPHRPLVLRTTVSFTVKLRFLANLSILKDGFLIRADFDKDVEELKTIKGFRQFKFNHCVDKAMNRENGSLVSEWSMEIKEIKENRKRSNATPIRVSEELHVIAFSSDLQFSGLKCHVETSSLPVVVVSTSTQIPGAWASVLWYNLVSSTQPTSLSLFLDPPPLSWDLLSRALSWQFIRAGDRELNQDQLDELRLRIADDGFVSWSKFSNQKHGPWIWIDGILDLIEKHLKEFWRENFIMGFVNKEKARQLLQNKRSGNFLLRFSESNREGAITFSWVEHCGKRVTVHCIDPFTKNELSQTSLADHINGFREKGRPTNPLLYLYPDIPKDHALGRFYAPPETSTSVAPYLKRKKVCEVDCLTPPPSPDHTQMDLDLDSMDIPSPDSLPSGSFDVHDLFPEVRLYNADNNMDVSESSSLTPSGETKGTFD